MTKLRNSYVSNSYTASQIAGVVAFKTLQSPANKYCHNLVTEKENIDNYLYTFQWTQTRFNVIM